MKGKDCPKEELLGSWVAGKVSLTLVRQKITERSCGKLTLRMENSRKYSIM